MSRPIAADPSPWLPLAALLVGSGVLHLARPEVYRSLIPKPLGDPAPWILWSGVAELACAAGLAAPRTRRLAGLACAGLFVGVLPANVTMTSGRCVPAARPRGRPPPSPGCRCRCRWSPGRSRSPGGGSGMAGVRRLAARAAVAGTSSAVAAGLGAAAVATVFARRIVTPDGERPDDVEVLSVDAGPGSCGTVTVGAMIETVAPGRCGIWQDDGRTHFRVGEVLSLDGAAVVRELLGTDRGTPRAGPGRWNQYYFSGNPSEALGLDFEDVVVPGRSGPLPGWLVPGGTGTPARTWAVLVHGRGATREEALRALPVLHRLGITSLVASYNTTEGLPEPVAGRYHLGDREWLDVESAVIYAAEQGADEVVLVGWSMGGAICLQTVSRSWTRDRVRGLVLDSPVIDWRDVLSHHARQNGLPRAVGWLGQQVLSHRQAWRLLGTDAPVDLNRLDWVARAEELHLPTLLIHSEDDDFVPSGPSRALASARPDLVTYQDAPLARHTREWNVDPEAWDAGVATFLLRL